VEIIARDGNFQNFPLRLRQSLYRCYLKYSVGIWNEASVAFVGVNS